MILKCCGGILVIVNEHFNDINRATCRRPHAFLGYVIG